MLHAAYEENTVTEAKVARCSSSMHMKILRLLADSIGLHVYQNHIQNALIDPLAFPVDQEESKWEISRAARELKEHGLTREWSDGEIIITTEGIDHLAKHT